MVSSFKIYKTFAYVTLTAGIITTYYTMMEIWQEENNYGRMPTSKNFYLLAGSAIGLDLITILLFPESNRKFRNAIKAFNNSVSGNHTDNNDEIRLNLTLNGLVLSYAL